MVHFLKRRAGVSLAASLVAAVLAGTPAQAGSERHAATPDRLLTVVRDNVASLETRAPGSSAVLRLFVWGARGFPPPATKMRPGAAAPAIDTTTTSALPPAIFSSAALPIRSIPAAAQWRPVYARLAEGFDSECASEACRARASMLEAAVRQATGARFVERLRVVNSAVNRMIGYASDRQIYGRLDYWATPSQTLVAGRGDCEDYAILKMAALKAAGIPVSSMSLVVLRDRERDLFHAILAVATDKGHFILDNAHDTVLLDSDVSRYQPLFSMSRDRYWLHGTRRSEGQLLASGRTSLRGVAPGEGPETLDGMEPTRHPRGLRG